MRWPAPQRFRRLRRRATPDCPSLSAWYSAIGINLGDVALVDGDVYGDGVNVAARLEQLAEPGGVMVSGTAYDHLQGKLDWPLDFVGEQQVKNITRPVRAYRLRLDGRRARWTLRKTIPRWQEGLSGRGHSTAFGGRRDLVVLAARPFERQSLGGGAALRQLWRRRSHRPAGRRPDRGHYHRSVPD